MSKKRKATSNTSQSKVKVEENIKEFSKEPDYILTNTIEPDKIEIDSYKSETNNYSSQKFPFSSNDTTGGKVRTFWEKRKSLIFNILTVLGLIVTFRACWEARQASTEAMIVNNKLQETIVKIDSITQKTESVTMKMAILSGAIARGDTILTDEERRILAESIIIINAKTPTARTAKDWLTKGYYSITGEEETKLEEAIQCYNEAISIDNGYAEAYYNLGVAYKVKHAILVGSLDILIQYPGSLIMENDEMIGYDTVNQLIMEYFLESEKAFKKAIILKPDYLEAYNTLGSLYFDKGKDYYNKAITCFQNAIKVDPQNIYAYTNLGIIYADLSQFEFAMINFKEAIEIKGSKYYKDIAYRSMGYTYYLQDSLLQAIDAFREAINISPDYDFAYLSLADVYLKQKDYLKALENYQRVVDLNVNYKGIYDRIATSYCRMGSDFLKEKNYDKAIEYHKLALETDSNHVKTCGALIKTYLAISEDYDKKGYNDKSIDYLKKALDIKPNSAELYNLIGMSYAKIEEYENSITYLQQACIINPDYADSYFNIGRVYTFWGKKNKAIDYLEQGLMKNPNNADGYYKVGSFYMHLHDYEKALEYFQQALKKDPGNPETYNAIGAIYGNLGDNEKAFHYFQKAFTIDPSNESARTNLQRANDELRKN